uniref:Uncharacterized protein n=1 Tax=Anguilla anguilla TaxID=7936 RepID=A0A0E9PZ15_ANGAN
MIIPHITYCQTSWTQTCKTTLKPTETVYKQALKVLDKRSNRHHHHCDILAKYDLLNWENLVKFADARLVFKILNCLAPT